MLRFAQGLVAVVLLFSLSSPSSAVPNLINYQGMLTNNTGEPITSIMNLEFDLFLYPNTGGPVWGETYANVPVTKGHYNVLLGSGTLNHYPYYPLSKVILDHSDDDLWLQVTINGVVQSPRQKLASIPFSQRAAVAESVVDNSIGSNEIVDGSMTNGNFADDSIPLELFNLPACIDGQMLMQVSGTWVCQEPYMVTTNSVVGCYEGPLATLDVGLCVSGSRKWTSSGPGACVGQVVPTAEICDGLDNDCVRGVDNDLTPPLSTLQDGVCAGAVKKCGGTSGWNNSYSSPYYVPSGQNEICDGFDNNCDGTVDENCVQTCADCHLGTGDVDSAAPGDGKTAMIDQFEWETIGHGRTTDYPALLSGNAGPNLKGVYRFGCAYCHVAPTYQNTIYDVSHNTEGNYFRLANVLPEYPMTADAMNNNCLVCHGENAAGYDPDGGLTMYAYMSSSAKATTAHYGYKHTYRDGGILCWDCHDPHGDSSAIDGSPLAFMIQRQPVEQHYSFDGVWSGVNAILAQPVKFPRNPDDGINDMSDYVDADRSVTQEGLCNNCHEAGYVADFNKEVSATSHEGLGSNRCIECHSHNDDFGTNSVGDCNNCHNTNSQGIRRAVGADFDRWSGHGLRRGDRTDPSSWEGELTNFDCIVCHLEGEFDDAKGFIVTTGFHEDGLGQAGSSQINLRNVDNPADTSLVWEENLGDATLAYSPPGVNFADVDGSLNWPMKENMTRFCLACHDADGASQYYSREEGASPYDPFAITLGSDAIGEHNLDVASQFNPSNFSTHSLAVLGYNGIYDPAGTGIKDEAFENSWTETSTLHCEDCHLPRVGDQLSGLSSRSNAHGSLSPYMLQNAEGFGYAWSDLPALGSPSALQHCQKCHSQKYIDSDINPHNPTLRYAHDQNSQWNELDKTKLGSETGISCFSCHGGGGRGSIHGVNKVIPNVDDNGRELTPPTFNSYFFFDGGAMGGWDNWQFGDPATVYRKEQFDDWYLKVVFPNLEYGLQY